mmetsp:Transcript_12506/g.21044  ORF Transcript_12506/g.21044 Transcript_12506/m.21044 type:complete len:90 (-) Transcript_12506:45-314(-)
MRFDDRPSHQSELLSHDKRGAEESLHPANPLAANPSRDYYTINNEREKAAGEQSEVRVRQMANSGFKSNGLPVTSYAVTSSAGGRTQKQ